MGDGHHALPALRQPAEKLHCLSLMRDIHAGGSLIYQQVVRVLRQDHGQISTLPLSPGQLSKQAVRERRHIRLPECRLYASQVCLTQHICDARPAEAAVRDECSHRHARGRKTLRKIGKPLRPRLRGKVRNLLPVHERMPPVRENARQRFQKGRLAASIFPDQSCDLPSFEGKIFDFNSERTCAVPG